VTPYELHCIVYEWQEQPLIKNAFILKAFFIF